MPTVHQLVQKLEEIERVLDCSQSGRQCTFVEVVAEIVCIAEEKATLTDVGRVGLVKCLTKNPLEHCS